MLRRTGGRPVVAVVLAVVATLTGCSGTEQTPTLAPSSNPPSPSALPASPTPTRSTASPTTTPTPTPSPTPTPTRPDAPRIVIDPGHSGRSIRSTDARTGLRDIDYPNYPEIYEMFDVSSCVQQGLVSDGYRVTLTKTKALASVSLAKRAAVATRAEADLAVSVHDDHSQTASFQATYSQRGVKHGGSYHAMYRGSGSRRTVFRDAEVARESERAAKIIARERSDTQDRKVSVRENTFTGRAPLEPGNLALVQLLTEVPWVYNEMGAKTGGSTTRAMSIDSETAYAKGLLLGIEAAVPIEGDTLRQPGSGAKGLRSCLEKRVEPSPGKYTRPKRYLPDGF